MNKIILCFVGEIASGKGAVCDYLIKKQNIGYHRYSTILRDILDRLRLIQSRENMQKISTALRDGFGQDLFAKVIAAEATEDPNPLVCIDGARRIPDIVYLKELPNFHLINVTADETVRFNRIIKRTENPDDAKKTFAQFQKDEQEESEIAIKELGNLADFEIQNNGGIEELHGQIENILTKIQAQ